MQIHDGYMYIDSGIFTVTVLALCAAIVLQLVRRRRQAAGRRLVYEKAVRALDLSKTLALHMQGFIKERINLPSYEGIDNAVDESIGFINGCERDIAEAKEMEGFR